MSRWLVGSSRIRSCGPSKVARPIEQPRLLAARQRLDRGVGARAGKADQRRPAADLRIRPRRASARRHGCRACRRARGRRPGAGRRSRLSSLLARTIFPAIGASRPPISLAKVDLPLPLAPSSPMRSSLESVRSIRDSTDAVAVAGADLLHRHDRRAELFGDRRPFERQDGLVDHRRDRLHLGQHLEARLGLGRLGRAGAETVDEGLQVGAPLLLLLQPSCPAAPAARGAGARSW